jgi:2-hydroxycyclohexanecarboxyl-CoA dehydrogenase
LFAEEGAAVALVDADAEAVSAAAKGLMASIPGGRVLPLVADLAREAEAERVVAEALARFGGLHCLVNVAAVRVYQSMAEATAEDWYPIFCVNALATA